MQGFIDVLGEDIDTITGGNKKLSYGLLHDVFNRQPDFNILKNLDGYILRRIWDKKLPLTNINNFKKPKYKRLDTEDIFIKHYENFEYTMFTDVFYFFNKYLENPKDT